MSSKVVNTKTGKYEGENRFAGSGSINIDQLLTESQLRQQQKERDSLRKSKQVVTNMKDQNGAAVEQSVHISRRIIAPKPKRFSDDQSLIRSLEQDSFEL